jgi:predicted RNase H-like nuclease (RuvC/YqgF family)
MKQLLQHISELETSCSALEQMVEAVCAQPSESETVAQQQQDIEQLQTENEQLRTDNDMLVKEVKKMQAEIDRLQAEKLQAEQQAKLQAEQLAEQQVSLSVEPPSGDETINAQSESETTEKQPASKPKRRSKKEKTDPNQLQLPFDF